jgi:hypothetical protein
MTETSWERVAGGRQHYVYVRPKEVVVGDQGGSVFSDCAGSCTHTEFLAGTFHESIEQVFGKDVLREIIEAVAKYG